MPYKRLLTLSVTLLLTGCLGTPKPTEHAKLSAYKSIESGCQENPPKTLQTECSVFSASLQKEQLLLDEMQAIREDAHEEPAYIALADQEAEVMQRLQRDRAALAKACQTQMPAIVKNDDINSATFCLLFDENRITLDEYLYLKRYAPRFDENRQYLAFEQQYAEQKLKEGLKAMNKGDKRSALKAFKSAYDAHSAEAAYLVGIIYEEKQIKKAISWHKKAVAAGVKRSKVNLARLYLRIKLPNKAYEWYLSAAKDGDALAQYRLFKMDAKSKSKKRQEEARLWLERSAQNNYPQAQYIYGLQLLKQKKREAAQKWLERAHQNGIRESGFFLGKLYFEQESYKKAYPHLLQATDKGEANYLLARMYESGLGVKKNSVLAYRHYKKAHEQAHDNHVKDMRRLQKRLTKKERIAAKYVGKKEAKRLVEIARRCGPLADEKNIRRTNKTIHIVGVAVKPVQNANGVIVYGEHEKVYYIIAPELARSLSDYQYVDLKAKATGKAIVISSDTGALQPVYQFYNSRQCSTKGK